MLGFSERNAGMGVDLQLSIERLYEAFSHESRPSAVAGCPCCLTEDEYRTLVAKDLRELSPDELTDYGSCALLTVGSESDFRYFLPRILEISVHDSFWWPGPEVVAQKIAMIGWNGFAPHQQEALLNLLDGVFQSILQTDEPGDELDTLICAAAAFVPDLTRYLNLIEDHPSALRDLFESNSESLVMDKLNISFWHDRSPEINQLVIDWFNCERVRAILNRAYCDD
jgi:hypothetical protein